MILSVSWKNVWRNKARSAIVMLSISFGLFGGIFTMAFMNGWIEQSVQKIIATDLSNIQLHNPDFLLNDETRYSIENKEDHLEKIRKNPYVKAASSRIKILAMAASASSSEGIVIRGIDPEEEKNVTTLNQYIIDGTYFDMDIRNPAVVGESLAKKLKLKVKSKLVVTMQSLNGEIVYEAFRIVGIYKTDNSMFDKTSVFVIDKDLANSISFDMHNTSEIAVTINNSDENDIAKASLVQDFSDEITSKQIVVRTWNEIQPAFQMMNDMTKQFSFIFLIIILFALSFGVVNTMLMVILERIHEIGMLMAIGMSKARVFLMILMETVFLSITGGIIGIILSFIVIESLKPIGIDLSVVADGLNAYGYTSYIYPSIQFTFYLEAAVLVIIMAMIASIFPAKKALNLNPAEAVRHEA